MTKYPKVLKTHDNFQVVVCHYESRLQAKEVEFVLDLNRFQDVIGIEILNLKLKVGEACLNRVKENISLVDSDLRYNYDEDTDAFYLQIANEVSTYQMSVLGKLALNADGEIIKFCAILEPIPET